MNNINLIQNTKSIFQRVRTVNCTSTKPRIKLDSAVASSNDKDSVININITNNQQRKKSPLRQQHASKQSAFRRNKTLFDKSQEDINTLINKIISQNVQNVNINININEVKRKASYSPRKQHHQMLWKKTYNFQKMVNAFLHPSVIKIEDSEIFNDTLKNTLMGSENKNCNFAQNSITNINVTNTNKSDIDINNNSVTAINLTPINQVRYDNGYECNNCHNKTLPNEIPLCKFLMKTEVEQEFIRVNIKEKAFKVLTDGNYNKEQMISQFEKLFFQNPEKLRYLPSDKMYLFNQILSNGKTLLYIACQEGMECMVRYFLEKKLNPNIRVKYFDMEDTCLWVSVRWGFYDIVKLLLDTNKLYEDDVIFAIKHDCKGSKKIRKMLEKYLEQREGEIRKSNSSPKKRGCACF